MEDMQQDAPKHVGLLHHSKSVEITHLQGKRPISKDLMGPWSPCQVAGHVRALPPHHPRRRKGVPRPASREDQRLSFNVNRTPICTVHVQ